MSEGKLFFNDLMEDYYAECEEHLTTVRRALIQIEPFVHRPITDRAPINELFRGFHTLKGLSAMVGLKDAEQLAHHVESYLRLLNLHQAILSPEALDVLRASTRTMEQVIASHRLKHPAPDIASVVSRLTALSGETQGLQKTSEEDSTRVASLSQDLKESEKERLRESLAAGAKAWCFEFKPDTELAKRGINVNTVRTRLQEIGELIHAVPRVTDGGGISFEFIVASPEPEEVFVAWEEDGISFEPYAFQTPAPSPAESAVSEPAPASLTTLGSSSMVRVDLTRLDELMQMVGDLVISRARIEEQLKRIEALVPGAQWRSLQDSNLTMERQLRGLREGIMRVRMVPIGEVFERMQFVVHELAREYGKRVRVQMHGQETELDKYVVDRMMDPLLHLVRNALSHGLETEEERLAVGKPPEGTLTLSAFTAGDVVVIEIADDGRGIDRALIAEQARKSGRLSPDAPLDEGSLMDILCTSGFSTLSEANLTSGRGIGMAVVKDTVQGLGGALSLASKLHEGTRFTIQLPLTLAIVDALIVAAGGQTFAVPIPSVREAIEVQPSRITVLENNELLVYGDGALPLLRLSRHFELPDRSRRTLYAIVTGTDSHVIGLVVDRLLGQREIVVRSLLDPLVQVQGFSGATELGDGQVVLILDTTALIRQKQKLRQEKDLSRSSPS